MAVCSFSAGVWGTAVGVGGFVGVGGAGVGDGGTGVKVGGMGVDVWTGVAAWVENLTGAREGTTTRSADGRSLLKSRLNSPQAQQVMTKNRAAAPNPPPRYRPVFLLGVSDCICFANGDLLNYGVSYFNLIISKEIRV